MMRALTVWQPWAALIMAGAKPYEFRRWPAPRALVGHSIVIHAGARPPKRTECLDLIRQIEAGAAGGLKPEIALPLLAQILNGSALPPLSAGLGRVLLGRPQRVTELFGHCADADGLDPAMWGWPMHEPIAFAAPVPARGAQGFWPWTGGEP